MAYAPLEVASGGTIVVAVIACAILGFLVALSRRDPVNADAHHVPSEPRPRRAAPRHMILASFSDYVEPTALWKIVAVSLLASVLVPVAFSVAILGQGRRDQPHATSGGRTAGLLMLVAGGLVCTAAIALGVWAMLQK